MSEPFLLLKFQEALALFSKKSIDEVKDGYKYAKSLLMEDKFNE